MQRTIATMRVSIRFFQFINFASCRKRHQTYNLHQPTTKISWTNGERKKKGSKVQLKHFFLLQLDSNHQQPNQFSNSPYILRFVYYACFNSFTLSNGLCILCCSTAPALLGIHKLVLEKLNSHRETSSVKFISSVRRSRKVWGEEINETRKGNSSSSSLAFAIKSKSSETTQSCSKVETIDSQSSKIEFSSLFNSPFISIGYISCIKDEK